MGRKIRIAKLLAKKRRTTLPRATDRLDLGRQRLRVSPFCLGMVRTPDTVLAAFDAGINFFFVTADMHWPFYEGLRQGLTRLFARRRGIRDEVVVAATAYVTQPEFCWMPFREVLAAVPGLRRIDVTVAGGAYGHEIGTRLALYREHLKTGHVGVRAIGTSFHDRRAAAESVREGSVDAAFIRYNPSHTGARRDVFLQVPDERRTLLYGFTSLNRVVGPSRCRELGLGSDHWYPSPADYYRFALTPPEMDGLLCAPQTPREIASLCRALEKGPLDEEEESYLVDLAALDEGRAELTQTPYGPRSKP